jgi:hypothetical protein
MKTLITISNDLLTVDGVSYNAGNYAALAKENDITIVHNNNSDDKIFEGAYSNLKLNGTSYGSAVLFCNAFNALSGAAIKRNTDYPDTIISTVLTPNTETAITDQAKPGSVILTTPAANTGLIYVGITGVGSSNYALASDKSIPLELKDLSKIFVKNSVAGEKVHVIGSYKS